MKTLYRNDESTPTNADTNADADSTEHSEDATPDETSELNGETLSLKEIYKLNADDDHN